jgi:hypothetical protein
MATEDTDEMAVEDGWGDNLYLEAVERYGN